MLAVGAKTRFAHTATSGPGGVLRFTMARCVITAALSSRQNNARRRGRRQSCVTLPTRFFHDFEFALTAGRARGKKRFAILLLARDSHRRGSTSRREKRFAREDMPTSRRVVVLNSALVREGKREKCAKRRRKLRSTARSSLLLRFFALAVRRHDFYYARLATRTAH